MAIRVACCVGYRGEPEPFAFWLGERRIAVRGIVDRWFAPTQRWLKVDTDEGNLYVLRCDDRTGDWELAAFTATEVCFADRAVSIGAPSARAIPT